MPASGNPQTAHFDSFFGIDVKQMNCDPPHWRQSYKACLLIRPCEMCRPVLQTRIKQGSRFPCVRIDPGTMIGLRLVAVWAGEAKVVERRSAAVGRGDDVVNVHRHDELFLSLTVFALAPGSLDDLLPQALRNPGHRAMIPDRHQCHARAA